MRQLFRKISVIVNGQGKEVDSPDVFLKINLLGKTCYIDRNHTLRSTILRESHGRSIQFARPFLDTTYSLHGEIASLAFPMRLAVITSSSSKLDFNKVFSHLWEDFTAEYLSERTISRITFRDVDLESLEKQHGSIQYAKDLRAFLRERGYHGWVSFFSILDAIYNGSITYVSELRSRPDRYTGLTQGPSVHPGRVLRHFNGMELGNLLFQLKNSAQATDRNRYLEIAKKFHEITSGMSLDVIHRVRNVGSREVPIVVTIPQIGGPGTPDVKVGSATSLYEVAILIKDEKYWMPLDFCAAGVFELLVLLTAVIEKQNMVLLLDEPALNLHPTRQVKLREILEQVASKNQVIMVTHSPTLVSMEHVNDTWRFVREKGETRVIHVGQELDVKNLRQQEGGKLSDIDLAQILFSSGIVLVEGPADKFAVEQFDHALYTEGANLRDDNWPVIGVGGKDSFPGYLGLAHKLNVAWVVLTDRDGIMQCNSSVASYSSATRTPGIFAFLIEEGLMNAENANFLKGIAQKEVKDDQFMFEDAKFSEIREIARKHGIFALTGKLEDMLNVAAGRGKLRADLEAVEDLIAKRVVPEIFKEFLSFVANRKNNLS